MSRQVGVRRSRFQPFAAPVIAEPFRIALRKGAFHCEPVGSAYPVGYQIRGAMPHVRHGESVLWRNFN